MKLPMLGNREAKGPPSPTSRDNSEPAATSKNPEHQAPLLGQTTVCTAGTDPGWLQEATLHSWANRGKGSGPRSQEQSRNMTVASELVLLPIRGERTQGPHCWGVKHTTPGPPRNTHTVGLHTATSACEHPRAGTPNWKPEEAQPSGSYQKAPLTPHGTSGDF